jgi:hypothetical protein
METITAHLRASIIAFDMPPLRGWNDVLLLCATNMALLRS